MSRPGFLTGVLEHATPGKRTSGFAVIFTTNDPQRPAVIITAAELSIAMAQTAAPITRTMAGLGIDHQELISAWGRLRACAASYSRSGKPGVAFDSLADWKTDYARRNKKDAPALTRLGRPQMIDYLPTLRTQDHLRQGSRPRVW